MSRIPEKKQRKSIRLKDYDYSQPGAYFVTICTRNKACLFGDVVNGEMAVNAMGQTVMTEWLRSADIRKEIELDEFIVMPNHVHGIIKIMESNYGGATGRSPLQNGPRPRSLGAFVAGFKSAVTKCLMKYAGCMVHLSGSAITMNTYFGMKGNCTTSANTLSIIR